MKHWGIALTTVYLTNLFIKFFKEILYQLYLFILDWIVRVCIIEVRPVVRGRQIWVLEGIIVLVDNKYLWLLSFDFCHIFELSIIDLLYMSLKLIFQSIRVLNCILLSFKCLSKKVVHILRNKYFSFLSRTLTHPLLSTFIKDIKSIFRECAFRSMGVLDCLDKQIAVN